VPASTADEVGGGPRYGGYAEPAPYYPPPYGGCGGGGYAPRGRLEIKQNVDKTYDTNLQKSEFVIMGAGPVGLWTALQLKLRIPAAKVTIYEKRQDYTREHMVRLGGDALWWSVGSKEPEIQKLIEVQAGGHGMKLKELEELLRSAVARFGAEIIERNIVDANELLNLHPHANAIIGADGRHSVLRETLMRPSDAPRDRNLEFIEHSTLQHTVYINLELQGDLSKLHLEGGALQQLAFSVSDSILHGGTHPVRLVVGRQKTSGRVSGTQSPCFTCLYKSTATDWSGDGSYCHLLHQRDHCTLSVYVQGQVKGPPGRRRSGARFSL
jgi:hypothetical protein